MSKLRLCTLFFALLSLLTATTPLYANDPEKQEKKDPLGRVIWVFKSAAQKTTSILQETVQDIAKPLPLRQGDKEISESVDQNGNWFTNYEKATEKAKNEGKMLLIYFRSDKKETPCSKFESESLENSEVKRLFQEYVLLKLPMDAKFGDSPKNQIEQVGFVQKETDLPKITPSEIDPKSGSLVLGSSMFAEMLNTPGLAMIDYRNKTNEYYGNVVSVFPFLRNKPYTVFETKTLLTLPSGTVTQRSMIYAVRVHPEKPKSTNGELNNMLEKEAESHSLHQAQIRRQGHHNWDSRFQRIVAQLPGELWASEVCAESWPNQHLLESAIECVDCWRQSSGHWSAVVAEHPYYGYDMKHGSNGIWYATGIFGKWKPGYAKKAASKNNG